MPATQKSKFGITLKLVRERRGLTLRALGQKTGIAFPYISLIESGGRGVGPFMAGKLADGLSLEGAERKKLLLAAQRTSTALGKQRGFSGCPPFLANLFAEHLRLVLRLDLAKLALFGSVESEPIFEGLPKLQLWFACARNAKPTALKPAVWSWIAAHKDSPVLLVVFLPGGEQVVVHCGAQFF